MTSVVRHNIFNFIVVSKLLQKSIIISMSPLVPWLKYSNLKVEAVIYKNSPLDEYAKKQTSSKVAFPTTIFLPCLQWMDGVFMHIFRLTCVNQSQCGRKAMVSLQHRNKSIAICSRQKRATFSCRSTKVPRTFLLIIVMLLAMSFCRWTKIATEWTFRWRMFCHVLPVLCDVSFC